MHPSVTLLPYALAGKDGSVTLRRNTNPEGSTITDKVDGEQLDAIEVRAVSLPSLLEEQQIGVPDLLKLDVEGSELEVLRACDDELLAGIKQITVEFHDFNGVVSAADVQDTLARFRRLGFSTLRMPWRFHCDVLMINRRLTDFTHIDALVQQHLVRRLRGATRMLKRRAGLEA